METAAFRNKLDSLSNGKLNCLKLNIKVYIFLQWPAFRFYLLNIVARKSGTVEKPRGHFSLLIAAISWFERASDSS